MTTPVPSSDLARLLAALVAGDPMTIAERQRLVDEFIRLRRLEADVAGRVVYDRAASPDERGPSA